MALRLEAFEKNLGKNLRLEKFRPFVSMTSMTSSYGTVEQQERHPDVLLFHINSKHKPLCFSQTVSLNSPHIPGNQKSIIQFCKRGERYSTNNKKRTTLHELRISKAVTSEDRKNSSPK